MSVINEGGNVSTKKIIIPAGTGSKTVSASSVFIPAGSTNKTNLLSTGVKKTSTSTAATYHYGTAQYNENTAASFGQKLGGDLVIGAAGGAAVDWLGGLLGIGSKAAVGSGFRIVTEDGIETATKKEAASGISKAAGTAGDAFSSFTKSMSKVSWGGLVKTGAVVGGTVVGAWGINELVGSTKKSTSTGDGAVTPVDTSDVPLIIYTPTDQTPNPYGAVDLSSLLGNPYVSDTGSSPGSGADTLWGIGGGIGDIGAGIGEAIGNLGSGISGAVIPLGIIVGLAYLGDRAMKDRPWQKGGRA